MRKIILFSTIIVFSLLITNNLHAQGLKFGVGGGLTSVTGPDAYTNSISDGGSGFSGEYHYGLKIKLSIPVVPLKPYAHVTNHNFSGEGTALLGGNIETSQSILQIGVGSEFSIVPLPISPYFAVEVAMNNLGDYERTAPLPEGNTVAGGGSRFGAGIGIGTEVTILPFLDFDVSAKYNWFNLAGKDDGEETISALTVNVLVLFNAI